MVKLSCENATTQKESDSMDEKKLKAELILKGMKLEDYAQYLGINKSTLYRKIKGISDFSLPEIKKSMILFGNETAEKIFFTKKVT